MRRLVSDPRLPIPPADPYQKNLNARLYELFRDILNNQNALIGGNILTVTTAEKNAITDGSARMVFDTTLGKLCVWTGSAWQTVTSV